MAELTRAYLAKVIREEASVSGADLDKVLNMVNGPGLLNVRHRIWWRVHQETGGTAALIANLWGCHPSSVFDGLRAHRRAWAVLDARKANCRTSDNPGQDLSSWRSLGRGGEEAA